MSTPKRFIAGAVCPKCAEMDRLVSYSNEEGTYKECVACGFIEKQLVQVEPSELNTRVNHVSDVEDENDVQIVQLMTPKPSKH